MKTSLFDFDLPESLIANAPVAPRDAARMLVVNEALRDAHMRDLSQFLKPGDVMVMNDTRVIPARLFGRRGEAKVEVLLHRPVPPNGGVRYQTPQQVRGLWLCFARPAKKLKPGDRIIFAEDFSAELIEKLSDGQVMLNFSTIPSPFQGEGKGGGYLSVGVTPSLILPLKRGGDFYEKLARYGHVPLPPYIRREDKSADRQSYQTVYAKHDGSVAAPTAGLHFTPELLSAIDAAGVIRAQVTLHVGGGTFLPVKAEDTNDHVMHSEWAEITPDAADKINRAKRNGGRIIAVGTTSLRTLESAADDSGQVKAFSGETDIFITPGYRFKTADMLLTNFHLPKSTLFMLICAFAGMEGIKAAYAHAIASKYRFYSYGDACLLYRNDGI